MRSIRKMFESVLREGPEDGFLHTWASVDDVVFDISTKQGLDRLQEDFIKFVQDSGEDVNSAVADWWPKELPMKNPYV